MITIDEIERAQNQWAAAVVAIGALRDDPEACRRKAESAVARLYAYDLTTVLFKPTKAADIPFRMTRRSAVSYFVAGDEEFVEDSGFAIQPWVTVAFDNAGVRIDGDSAVAMGHYTFTDDAANSILVEYSLGYLKDDRGELRIWLHHSSLPFGS